ncbi:hypothetical protein [Adhaeribacter aquaticus]|uniref:hypothetical protein n=1 Tax=Adhaeribacter aquaticus TaxID=299567 RepID=UPI00047C2B8E|nr:hypothetical protein [Adhaeribacter aquaticus]
MLVNGVFAQERNWEVALGIGLPEFLQIGLNRDIAKRNSLGFNFGYIPLESYTSVHFTLEHKLNFHYSRKFATLPTWHFGQRLTYIYEDNGTKIFKTLYLTPSIGRHLNITNRFGLNTDFGASIKLWGRKIPDDTYEDESNLRFLFLPSARIQLVYKF